MKTKFRLLAGVIISVCCALSTWALPEPSHMRLGAESSFDVFTNVAREPVAANANPKRKPQ